MAPETRLNPAAGDPMAVAERLNYYDDDPLAHLVSPVPCEIARNLTADDIV